VRPSRRRASVAVHQRHPCAGHRLADPAHHRRSHHHALFVRGDRAFAAVERHPAGFRGHRPGHLQPRSGADRRSHHPAHHRHPAGALLWQSLRRRAHPANRRHLWPQGHLRRRPRLWRSLQGRKPAQAWRPGRAEFSRHQGVQHLRGRRHRLPRRQDQAAHRLPQELRLRRRSHRRRARHQRQDERGQRGLRPVATQTR